jgi:tetratricopeptide (TPR) repeat protein
MATTARELKQEGLRLYEEGLFDEAAEAFVRARDMFLVDRKEVEAAEMTNNLGLIRRGTGDYEEAARLLESAKAVFTRLGDRSREAQVLGNLGGLYATMGQREKAKHCLRQAADMFAELEDTQRQGETLMALAGQMWKTGDRRGGLAAYEAGVQTLPRPSVSQKAVRGLVRLRNRLLGSKSEDEAQKGE